ncbi:prostaglandin E synthase 2 [Lepeophtheirus salmonis]|uniref:prostaglandin E synthase 2 n=1 Tax=Lepeophtheirus salmonis TaxID=72036 RepID=UPI001AEAFFFC|nr:prostaglandin E synthase 2-like [Lepeophtheirus salmonis]XP_040573035.1 prostaglandin E synthase 2-like [Lepeophtheirus salmonis]
MNHKLSKFLGRISSAYSPPSPLASTSPRCYASSSSPSKLSTSPRLALGGVSVAGGLYALYNFWPTQSQSSQIVQMNPDSEPIPHILPEAPPYNDKCIKIRYPEDKTKLKLTLYQYTTCPFCCKVRAFLDYFGISYDIVEVNSVFRKEIKWSPNYKKVPILVVKTPQGDFLQLNDSTMIISALMTYLKEPSKNLKDIVECYPQVTNTDPSSGKSTIEIRNKYFIMHQNDSVNDKNLKEELKWRKWVDSVFVHRISPNVYRSLSESIEAFHWFDTAGNWKNVFNTFERQVVIYLGASVMWILGKVLKKRHGLPDDVREAIYHEVNNYLSHVKKKGGSFGGGEVPDLADISFYGTLNSFEGCAAFQDVLSHTELRQWFTKMKWAVSSRAGGSSI